MTERQAMRTFIYFLFINCLLLISSSAFAITPGILNEWLETQKEITIIDIRSTDQYQQSHIPGAINIPALICFSKKIPPLGHVVVYSDGLDSAMEIKALDELNQKQGIQAELLLGGFTGWINNQYSVTGHAGMIRERLPYVNYQQFEKIVSNSSDVLFLDIRNVSQHTKNSTQTDLQRLYPNIQTIHSPFGNHQKKENYKDKLMVLIDNADGRSEKMAHTMKAAGIKRFVILTGGEKTLSRKGKSDIQPY